MELSKELLECFHRMAVGFPQNKLSKKGEAELTMSFMTYAQKSHYVISQYLIGYLAHIWNGHGVKNISLYSLRRKTIPCKDEIIATLSVNLIGTAIYRYVYICVYISAHTNIYIFACVFRVYVYIHIYRYVCICKHIYLLVCVDIDININVNIFK